MTLQKTSREQLDHAIEAVLSKKAQDVVVLALGEVTGFTDYFLICSGTSGRQVQAIADEVQRLLQADGLRPSHVEGYNHAEWVLIDYVDFVVHVFSERARSFYGLERLWKTARRIPVSEAS